MAEVSNMVNRLLPTHAPPKEGRTYPHHHGVNRWRRSPQARVLAILFGLAVTYFFFSITFAPGREPSTDQDRINRFTMPQEPLADGKSGRLENHDKRPLTPTEKASTQASIVDSDTHTQVHSKSYPLQSGSRTYNGPESEADFLNKLQDVISLLPDEVSARELLREPKETGKERLREMGLRTRSFTNYFEAWEALHFVTDGDSSSIRDDIVQHLYTIMNGKTLADTVRAYEQFRHFFHQFANLLFPWISPYWANHLSMHAQLQHGGRGLVLSAGDYHAPYLLTSIQSFRKLGCTLPIEVMYLGESDLDEVYRQHLEDLPNVITRDLSRMVSDEGWQLAGWASKPFAIMMSSFREVIFIDADSLFFEDPAILFEDPGYVETGALFFRDRAMFRESKKRWLQQILPKPISKKAKQSYMWTGRSGHYQEAGVVVVDKWRHFAAMLLVTRMNGPDRDGDESKGIVGVYDMVYGDKETYWLAWELTGDLDYSFHEGSIGIMGTTKGHSVYSDEELAELEGTEVEIAAKRLEIAMKRLAEEDEKRSNFTICAPQLLHLHIDGRPLWFNGWVAKKKEDDKTTETMAIFEKYLVEPTNTAGKEDPWELHPGNICCLTADKVFDFTAEQLSVLDMIFEVARDVIARVEAV